MWRSTLICYAFISGFAIGFVIGLTDVPGDADKIADCGFGEPFTQLAEQGDAVPLRIGFPSIAVTAVVTGGNRDVGDVLGVVHPAEPSYDVKFYDILHEFSPNGVGRTVLTDIEGPRAACVQAKKRAEAPFIETVGRRLVFCLRVSRQRQAAKRPSISDII